VPSPLEVLLARAESVTGSKARRCGTGYRLDCPVGHRSRGTLACAEGENGSVILKDHAGCEVAQIVQALGLQMSDLFPARLQDSTPEGRRQARTAIREASVLAAMALVEYESRVVLILAGDLLRGQTSESDIDRARTAVQRIEQSRAAFNAR